VRHHRRKKFYGSVTVSERGQIVIPTAARGDFGIEAGDKLLVLGDLNKGIALVKGSLATELLGGVFEAFHGTPKADETGEEGET
jgi:AbrB family looped-hinge helix DNA binding protein